MKRPSDAEKPSILVVDDDPRILALLEAMLTSEDYPCVTLNDGRKALAMVEKHQPFLVLSDLFLGNVTGLDVLRELKERDPEQMVIIMTGSPSIETAVPAIQMGALDYLSKPLEMKQVILKVRQAWDRYGLLAENRRLKAELEKRKKETRLVGHASVITKVVDAINTVAATDVDVLIHGESGTGKELVARELRDKSNRADKPFVPVDCVALSDQLISSELFGHEKGAFTGADQKRVGLFELAHGGTIFLDEITELGMELQAKLLRVLQERQFRRVGGRDLIDADVRIVSATNRNPKEAVDEKRLRLDLYYRLNVVPIKVPPLRERREDIPLLADHFLHGFCEEHHRPMKRIEPPALDALKQHDWPGNVRELQHLMRRFVIMTPGDAIGAHDVREALSGDAPPLPDFSDLFDLPLKDAKRKWAKEFEKEYITRLLQQHGGVITRAAEAAGVDRKTLTRLAAEHDVR